MSLVNKHNKHTLFILSVTLRTVVHLNSLVTLIPCYRNAVTTLELQYNRLHSPCRYAKKIELHHSGIEPEARPWQGVIFEKLILPLNCINI